MPIYEYVCVDCDVRFDELRSMSDADAPIDCSQCGSEHTSRVISLFAAHSDGRVVAGSSPSCGTCSSGACSNCSV